MVLKSRLMDGPAMDRAITRIAHEIIENNGGTDKVVLIGIRTRGVPLAYRIRQKINDAYSVTLPIGILDTVPYRDDKLKSDRNLGNNTKIDFKIEGTNVVLIDDVLFTGRTVRAGIEAIIAMGRPNVIQLAVMIDRGHRELPIRPDFVGKNVPTSLLEMVNVNMVEKDNEDSVLLYGIE